MSPVSATPPALNLLLTSDLPLSWNDEVLRRMKSVAATLRIAFIPPFTDVDRVRFRAARDQFASRGFEFLEYCDIDADVDAAQLARLDGFDIVYLSGGDPLRFRSNISRSGLAERLRARVASGRMIVAASGGAMQLTRNVSLFRLEKNTVDDVIANHGAYEGLGIVGYELLPHRNRHTSEFIEKVRQYSEHIEHDVVALDDGAAVVHTTAEGYACTGTAVRFRRGEIAAMQ